jgi:VCBS repeat-containing protein
VITQTVNVTVAAVNDAPTITLGANQIVNEDSGAQSIANWATGISTGPANESAQTLAFTITNDNNALFADQPVIGVDGKLTYKFADNANGSATVTVVLSDNGGTANGGVDSVTKTFTITANPVNDAPTITLGADQVVNEDSGAQSIANWATGITAGPADESAQTLGFAITTNNNALFAELPMIGSDGKLTYKFADNANGSATVTVVLSDNGGTNNGGSDSVTKTFTITANPVNDLATFKGDVTGAVTEDDTLIASGTLSVEDVDTGESTFKPVTPAALVGTYGTFTFMTETGKWDYTLNNSNGVVQALNSGDTLTDTLTVESFDGTTEDIIVTINGANEPGGGNTAPALIVGAANPDQVVQAGTPLSVTVGDGHFKDAQTVATDLTYSMTVTLNGVVVTPTWLTLAADGGVLTADPTSADAGTYVVSVFASDGSLTSSADEFNLTVTAPAAGFLRGTKGKDNLVGGDGDDTINGRKGNDKLTGGDGADTFVFSKGHDKVLDFDPSEGDLIDLGNAKGIKNFNDLMNHHIEDTDAGLKIIDKDGNWLFLKGDIDADDLTADMFLF